MKPRSHGAGRTLGLALALAVVPAAAAAGAGPALAVARPRLARLAVLAHEHGRADSSHRHSRKRVKITGAIGWRQFVPTPKVSDGTTSGGDTQKGTFKIRAKSTTFPPLGTRFSVGTSSYNVSDKLHQTTKEKLGSATCTTTVTGSVSRSGPLAGSGATFGKRHLLSVVWALPFVSFNPVVDSGHEEDITTKVTGPARCDPGTTTSKQWVTFQPTCYREPPELNGLYGRFRGKHDVGTIKVTCHGKFEGITYSATGRLKVSVVK
jgi:hypothetical protein